MQAITSVATYLFFILAPYETARVLYLNGLSLSMTEFVIHMPWLVPNINHRGHSIVQGQGQLKLKGKTYHFFFCPSVSTRCLGKPPGFRVEKKGFYGFCRIQLFSDSPPNLSCFLSNLYGCPMHTSTYA